MLFPKHKNKKGALSLPINFLVILIISLVIFGFGITFLYKLFSQGKSLEAQLDSQTQAQLERLLLKEGKRVVLSTYNLHLYSGKSSVFGVGILNIDSNTFGENFYLNINLSKASTSTQIDPSDIKIEEWFLYNPGPYLIKENEYRSEPIMISPPPNAPKGNYIFNIKISYGNNEKESEKIYGSIKKLVVTVK